MKITKTGQKGLKLIKEFEGFRSKPYLCSAGVPTIGYGATYYPSGKKVTLNDQPITEEYAVQLLSTMLDTFEKAVDSFCRDDINQDQFDALVSFAYNLGNGSLKSSTLLKKVNANPNDPTIRDEFMKWVNAGGKKLPGLVRRRQAEADLYFGVSK
jgi:lysozyme